MNRQLDVSFELTQEITELSTDLLTLSRVLGIFLDNAIEAASETEQKRFHIAIVCKVHSVIFHIENSTKPLLWESFSSQVFLPKKRTAVLDFPPQICWSPMRRSWPPTRSAKTVFLNRFLLFPTSKRIIIIYREHSSLNNFAVRDEQASPVPALLRSLNHKDFMPLLRQNGGWHDTNLFMWG